MAQDVWNPKQYDQFKEQRSQPFFDLMNLLIQTKTPRVADLGCGTGELTAQLSQHLKASETIGIDTSDAMLEMAKSYQTDHLKFQKADIENWNPEKQFDVICSNAALQWCSDHARLFESLTKHLAPQGQIAIQMPMNFDYPTHTLAGIMSKETHWANLLGHEAREPGMKMLKVEEYARLLFKLGFQEQKVFLRVYGNVMDSRESVIEWVKGTTLNFVKSRLSDIDYQKFVSEYRERLFQVLPDDKPFFYPFKRVLIWGRR